MSAQAKEVQIVEAQNNALTPMEILNRAVAQGADIDVLDKLMGLQERWDRNQATKEFNAAISAAKAEIKPIARNKTGHNNKKYADMAATAAAVDPILSKHGLGYRYRTTQTDRINVSCVLFHKAGHSEENTLSGAPDKTGSKNDIQAIGSTLTYLQRYTLFGALGLAAGDDDDGRAAGLGECITDEQADAIRALLTETKTDAIRFLNLLGAESVADIQATQFDDAMALLNAKKKKAVQS